MPRLGPASAALRQVEIADMRARILASAKALARSKGWGAVSIRAIAAEIHYSPPLLYTYFKDKAEILAELQHQGLRELGARLQGQSTIVEMGVEFFDFAIAQPELYAVMTGRVEGCPPLNPEALAEASMPVTELLHTHPAKDLRPEETFIQWWSVTNGFIESALGGLSGGQEESRALLERTLQLMTKG